jgi:hypothetical protein
MDVQVTVLFLFLALFTFVVFNVGLFYCEHYRSCSMAPSVQIPTRVTPLFPIVTHHDDALDTSCVLPLPHSSNHTLSSSPIQECP